MSDIEPTKKALKEPLFLSQEYSGILDQLENTNQSFFITGKAGTGKSTLLQLFRKTSRKRIAVVAPTGIAALNVKGQTIHSFFRFPPKMMNHHDIHKLRNHKLYKNINTLVIDEISMVRADVFDNIDLFLRKNREIDEPFGGVQVLVFGDLFQLPPVISSAFEKQYFRTKYSSPYFFSAKVLEQGFELPMIELREVYRQDDRGFIQLLDNIRLSTMDYDDLDLLNQRYGAEKDENPYIILCSVNATVNKINSERLNALESNPQEFRADIKGVFKPNVFPTDQFLHIKEGAQVMFVKNDLQKRYVNGTIGTVLHVSNDRVEVEIINAQGDTQVIDVERQEWELVKYALDEKNPKAFKTEVTGSFTQYPLKLAWAITIHKSQGKTFDNVILDLGRGAFEYGQTYVALSRCRTFEGIILKQKISPRDILTDERIREFYESQRYYW